MIQGLGTDIVEIVRIGEMIERHGELFLQRVYTDQEVAYCQKRTASYQHFAGRWAAKEAVLKALGTGWAKGIAWRDIEVVSFPSGQPRVAIHGGGPGTLRAGRDRWLFAEHIPLSQPCYGSCGRRPGRRQPESSSRVGQ